jgi:hypothetical protein
MTDNRPKSYIVMVSTPNAPCWIIIYIHFCYSALLDHEKLGYDLTAIIELTAVKGKITEVEKHISKFPNVHCNRSKDRYS